MLRAVEKWTEIRIREQMTIKSWTILPIGRLNHIVEFQWNQVITFAVILLTDTQTQTHNHDQKRNLSNFVGEGNKDSCFTDL